MERKPGQRVGAVLSADRETVNFLGYGTYEGDFIPDDSAAGQMARVCRALDRKNPKIRLDDGRIVWGCECYWGPEDDVARWLDTAVASGLAIVNTDIEEVRKAYRGRER